MKKGWKNSTGEMIIDYDNQRKIDQTGFIPMAHRMPFGRGRTEVLVIPRGTVLLRQFVKSNYPRYVGLEPVRTLVDVQFRIKEAYIEDLDWEDVP